MEPLLAADAVGAERIGTADFPEPVERPVVCERLDGLVSAFRALEAEVRHVREILDRDEVLAEGLEGRVLDLQSVERRLAGSVHALRTVLDPEDGEDRFVRWLEWRGRRNLVIASAPIELGGMLRQGLFENIDTVVLASATLATRGSFGFLRSRIGLSPDDLAQSESMQEITEAIIPSPFDFEHHTILGVPTDLPDVNSPGGALEEATARIVAEMADITDGGMFVLFTSYRALRRVAELLRAGGGLPWPLFVQGEDGRARLLESFVASGSGHPARHVFLLGGRGRAGTSAKGPGHSAASFPRAHRAGHGCPRRGHREAGRQRLLGLRTAAGGASAEARLRAPGAFPRRSRQRGDLGRSHSAKAVRRVSQGVASAGSPCEGTLERGRPGPESFSSERDEAGIARVYRPCGRSGPR